MTLLLDFITPSWPALRGINVVSTTRHGGQSRAPWNSLNLGVHVNDKEADVRTNRELLSARLQWPSHPQWLNQVHGSAVYELPLSSSIGDVEESSATNLGPITADASSTSEPGRVLAILTADCLPVVFADPVARRVAAAHAGWRSLAAGVVQNTLRTMGSEPSNVHAWLGPAIGPKAFEVGDDVREAFLAKSFLASSILSSGISTSASEINIQNVESAFTPNRNSQQPDKWFADLYQLARLVLNSAGVTQISGGDRCTYSEQDHFFSHRRDGPATGRMGTFVWMDAL